MKSDLLSNEERLCLLRLARQSIELAVQQEALPELDLQAFSERLQQPGASFVTLTLAGHLRGCIGALQAYQPLVEDVREHAVAAAMDDWRFQTVRLDEVKNLHIEISCLTDPEPVEYNCPEDLLTLLVPGLDGVVLQYNGRRATFLPQVWEKVPLTTDFLAALCNKMGAGDDLWQREKVEVFTYRVESFEDECGPDLN